MSIELTHLLVFSLSKTYCIDVSIVLYCIYPFLYRCSQHELITRLPNFTFSSSLSSLAVTRLEAPLSVLKRRYISI